MPYMDKVIEFLHMLRENNNREWFGAHKGEYLAVLAKIEDLASTIIAGIGEFDETVRGLTVKDCTYRIYRDIRFSPDKRPYKTHIGIFICPGGKKSGHAGYYLHIEPSYTDEGITCGGHFLFAGLHMPAPDILHSVREEICFNGEEFERNIAHAEGFTLIRDNMLKRVPAGFPADSPFAQYLKLKDIGLEMPLDDRMLTSPNFADTVIARFASTYPLTAQLNKAVTFALEE